MFQKNKVRLSNRIETSYKCNYYLETMENSNEKFIKFNLLKIDHFYHLINGALTFH